MSVISMAEVAFVRRTDVALPLRDPAAVAPGATRFEVAATAIPDVQSAVTGALKVIATYIPTEVLTLYVAVLAAIRAPEPANKDLKLAFYGFLIITPLVMWLVYAAKCKAAGKRLPLAPRSWPLWEMFASTVAYTAWALTLAENPFAVSSWYSPALAAVVVLIVSTFVGLLAPLFQRPIQS
jgi:hypothetical protein